MEMGWKIYISVALTDRQRYYSEEKRWYFIKKAEPALKPIKQSMDADAVFLTFLKMEMGLPTYT